MTRTMVNTRGIGSFFLRAIFLFVFVLISGTVVASDEGWRADTNDLPLVASGDFSDVSTDFSIVELATWRDMIPFIARRYGTTSREIIASNPGLNNENFKAGDALIVPGKWDDPPRASLHLAKELRRGLRGRKQIALTFDAGWVTKKELASLLAVLKQNNIRASFFLTGIFMKEHPKAPETIVRAGHLVFNHSWSHPQFTKISDADMVRQLMQVERTVAQCVGETTSTLGGETVVTTRSLTTRPFWRPPYGERNEHVKRVVAMAGFRSAYWTVDSLDWMTDPPASVESVFHRVCERPFEMAKDDADPLDGAIILFHVSGKPTPDALGRIVPYLRDRGYSFVTLPEMLEP